MTRAGMFVVLALAAPAAAGAGAGGQTAVAVMTLRADTDASEGLIRTLNEVVLSEFDRSPRLKTLGYSDVSAMLQHEELSTKFEQCNDNSCLAELGGALGVRLMAVPSLGAVGDKYVVNLKLIDVAGASVLSRTSEIVARDEDELLAAFKRAVGETIAKALPETPRDEPPAAEPRTEGAGAAGGVVQPAERSSGLERAAPWVTLGLSAAAGATAGVLCGLAVRDEQTANEKITGTAAWRDAKTSAEDKALAADILFGAAGAAAVATLVLFLVADEAPAATVSYAPAPGGGVAACSWRF